MHLHLTSCQSCPLPESTAHLYPPSPREGGTAQATNPNPLEAEDLQPSGSDQQEADLRGTRGIKGMDQRNESEVWIKGVRGEASWEVQMYSLPWPPGFCALQREHVPSILDDSARPSSPIRLCRPAHRLPRPARRCPSVPPGSAAEPAAPAAAAAAAAVPSVTVSTARPQGCRPEAAAHRH